MVLKTFINLDIFVFHHQMMIFDLNNFKNIYLLR